MCRNKIQLILLDNSDNEEFRDIQYISVCEAGRDRFSEADMVSLL